MTAKFAAQIDYGDPYVQPLILAALRSQIPASSYKLIQNEHEAFKIPTSQTDPSSPNKNADAHKTPLPLLQILPYESLSFPRLFNHHHHNQQNHTLLNSYTIRKALIRKHYLSNTVAHHVAKNPYSALSSHVPLSLHFELDYAEFLDEALVEAFELREAFARNEGRSEAREREWWILKPGMSDGGMGIRLFSTERELREVFEGWEEEKETDDEDDENDDDVDAVGAAHSSVNGHASLDDDEENEKATGFRDAINASHLRHFLVQPYIHPPLQISEPPYCNRKFHIRTYVVAAGALNVYVYGRKLALFASEPYRPPWETSSSESDTKRAADASDSAANGIDGDEEILRRMRNIHLTNTCMQTKSNPQQLGSKNVFLLSDLPLPPSTHSAISAQINNAISELFRAAVAQPTNFQPSPNCLEVFGVDFLVSEDNSSSSTNDTTQGSYYKVQTEPPLETSSQAPTPHVHLLEVNAFPDFAQTGKDLRQDVVGGLWEDIMREVVRPHFVVECDQSDHANWKDKVCNEHGKAPVERQARLTSVLNLNLGFR
ncbi:MAG: hypothetical protein M1831_007396 [Alyxoria varia]|nr:MAG: hypothetical protein M1831_007396 [Alyxoria varia]